MAILHNKILIDAPIDRILEALTIVSLLDTYDPTVKKSTAISNTKAGVGAKRKEDMLDDKNWFEETCIVSNTNKALTYELTACSFSVHSLKHDYSFVEIGGKIQVEQVMNYTMKYGCIGKIIGAMLKPKMEQRD